MRTGRVYDLPCSPCSQSVYIEPNYRIETVHESADGSSQVPTPLQKQENSFLKEAEKPKQIKVLPGQSTQIYMKNKASFMQTPHDSMNGSKDYHYHP